VTRDDVNVDFRSRIISHLKESSAWMPPARRHYWIASCTSSATTDLVNFRSALHLTPVT